MIAVIGVLRMPLCAFCVEQMMRRFRKLVFVNRAFSLYPYQVIFLFTISLSPWLLGFRPLAPEARLYAMDDRRKLKQ